MIQSYYNTTNLFTQELRESEAKAKSQEEAILSFFRVNPNSLYSPCDIWTKLFKDKGNTPITSARRSVTNLQLSGHLVKTIQYKTGIYGKKVYMWKLFIK